MSAGAYAPAPPNSLSDWPDPGLWLALPTVWLPIGDCRQRGPARHRLSPLDGADHERRLTLRTWLIATPDYVRGVDAPPESPGAADELDSLTGIRA